MRKRWALLWVLLGCDRGADGGGAVDPADDARRAVLASLGERVIRPAYAEFATAAAGLRDACAALAAAPGDAEALAAAQAAWRAAMDRWQVAEMMLLGPAGPKDRVGGEDRRAAIYAWPTVNACRVDQEIAAAGYRSPDFFARSLPNVTGLGALESLLFRRGPENVCPPQVAINREGTWAALDPAEIGRRRAEYARAAAAEVARHAEALAAAFADLARHLADAGRPGSRYPSTRRALDDLFAALFYLDLMVKDVKLAGPAGIADGRDAPPCPDCVELPWSRHSRAALAANLLAAERLLLGDPPDTPGFDDLVPGRIAAGLAADLAAARAAVDALPDEVVAGDPGPVRAAHAAVKRVTDRLKREVVTALTLTVPREGAGDAD